MKKLIILLFLVVLVSGLYNCGAPRPDQELNTAKEKIEIAQNEEAPKYASEEFSIALNDYTDATNATSQGKNDIAKQKAISSISNSDIAIAKTRKLKAEESLSNIDNLLKEASELKADILIPEEFENYKKSYEVSKSLYDQGMYQDSYTNSKSFLPYIESSVSDLRTRWNNARTELSNATYKLDRIKSLSVSKRLTNEIAEIDNIISEARNLLDNAKLEESIQKSKEAQSKIEGLRDIIKKKNEEYLDETGKKLKDLKINRKITFIFFGKKVTVSSKGTKIAQVTTYEEPKPTTTKSLSEMTDEELANYKTQLKEDINKLKSEIKELYNSSQIDYSNGEYEKSLDTLDKVNELLSQYNDKETEYNNVLREIEKRSKKEVVQPKQETKEEVKVTEVYKIYKVIKGDFLSKIASKLFNGEYWWWPKIFVLNKDKIPDPDLIEEGQELKVPSHLPE